MNLEAQGSGSILDVSNLASLSVGSTTVVGGASLTAVQDGQLELEDVTTLDDFDLTVDGSSGLPDRSDHLLHQRHARPSVAATPAFVALSDVDGSDITVSGGATLSLPLVTAYTGSGKTLEATGTGSALNLIEPGQLHRHIYDPGGRWG